MSRKYTVNVDDSEKQLKREFEFHNPQKIQICSIGNIYTTDISKLVLSASNPNFRSQGELSATFSLDEKDETTKESYRIGNRYDCTSKLGADFNRLEANLIGHFIEGKNFTFRLDKEDLYLLEFEDIRENRNEE